MRPVSRLGAAGVLAQALLAAACRGQLESTASCPFGFRDAPVGTQPDDLSCVDLGGANLTVANFRWTDLSGPYMNGANLTDVRFTEANLNGANLTDANLNGATWSDTTCPDGSNTDTNTSGRCR